MLGSNSQTKQLVEVFKKGTRLTYKKGEYIVRPGEHNSAIFYIQTGIVKAFDITKYGEENLLILRQDHDVFPLIWAVTGQEASVIYQVLTDTIVWRIARQKFLDAINLNSGLLAPILDMTVEMYRIHSERIMGLEYRTVRERLISYLLNLSVRFGIKINGGIKINVPLKQQDLASSINATRETTGRELGQLERKDLIIVEKSFIYIKDSKKLKSYL